MFGNQGLAKSALTFALLGSILGNVVVGLPTTPTGNGKDDDTTKIEQTFFSVQCIRGSWGEAQRCGAWCSSAGRLNVNRTRCPAGSQAADDVYFDCYCIGECTPCNDRAKAEAEARVKAKEEVKPEAEG